MKNFKQYNEAMRVLSQETIDKIIKKLKDGDKLTAGELNDIRFNREIFKKYR